MARLRLGVYNLVTEVSRLDIPYLAIQQIQLIPQIQLVGKSSRVMPYSQSCQEVVPSNQYRTQIIGQKSIIIIEGKHGAMQT